MAWPSCGVPEIVGGDVFAGVVARRATALVARDWADAPPAALRAVTETMRRRFRSREVSVYRLLVAPATFPQLLTARLHRTHWYEKLIGRSPLQVPGEVVNVSPTRIEPEIAGSAVLRGGVA
jgi:hypothetical protein